MARRWIEHAPCLPKETMDFSREKFHKCLVNNVVKKVHAPRPGKPVAILTMGAPATGKSTMIAREIGKGKDFVRVDPDAIKEELPEYVLAVRKNARDAGSMAQRESATVADMIAARAMKERKNLVIDGTGKTLHKYLDAIAELKRIGYHVTVLAANVPLEEARRRAAIRAEQSGRWIPDDYLEDVHSRVPCNIPPIADAADDFALFDNAGKEPRTVLVKKHGRLQTLDPAYVAQMAQHCPAERRAAGLGLRVRRKQLGATKPSVPLAELLRRIRAGR